MDRIETTIVASAEMIILILGVLDRLPSLFDYANQQIRDISLQPASDIHRLRSQPVYNALVLRRLSRKYLDHGSEGYATDYQRMAAR